MKQTLINLFDKLSETNKIMTDSLSELEYVVEINNAIYFGDFGGRIVRIVFYDGISVSVPTSDKYMFEIKLTEEKAIIVFGKQSVALDSKSAKILSELCELAEAYIKEYESNTDDEKE